MLPDRRAMRQRRIPLVLPEPVRRVLPPRCLHQPVPRHLRHDRGGGDARRALVAADQVALGAAKAGELDEIRQDQLGNEAETGQRLPHGHPRGGQDVDPVDGRSVHVGHADGEGLPRDDPEQPLSLFRRQALAVVEPADPGPGPQDDRGRHHRPGQRSAPGLVHAGDARQAAPPRRHLEPVRGALLRQARAASSWPTFRPRPAPASRASP